MKARAYHLHEDRLFECYLSERETQTIDPRDAEHLSDCAACSARYMDLVGFMNTLQHDGEADADAVFTPERLRQQQQQIARRLALVGRPARVISFPSPFSRRTIGAPASHTAVRWAAAAAAAGLFIGVAVGAGYEWRIHPQNAPRLVGQTARPRLNADPVRPGNAADTASDDAFLSDLEAALERPHTHELRAFDAFTPHVRAVRTKR
jgi:hypothetical protein